MESEAILSECPGADHANCLSHLHPSPSDATEPGGRKLLLVASETKLSARQEEKGRVLGAYSSSNKGLGSLKK